MRKTKKGKGGREEGSEGRREGGRKEGREGGREEGRALLHPECVHFGKVFTDKEPDRGSWL
jgi:hypothetical protein